MIRNLLLAGVLGTCTLAASAPVLRAQTGAPRALGIDTTHFDRTVRPQDDFFRYVNGRWLRETQIPADRSRYGSFEELADRSEAAVRELVEGAAASSQQPGSDLQKVGDLYRSFMDTTAIEALGVRPVRPELERIAAVRSKAELPELFAGLARAGIQLPFAFSVGQDQKQATRYVAAVSQSGLGLPDRDYYLRDEPNFREVRDAYRSYIETLFRLAGEPDPAAAARNVLELESGIARLHWERARTRDREATYNFRTVEELDRLTPAFSWSRFLRAAGAERTPGVVVRQPDYLSAFGKGVEETPLPVIKQYLAFKVLDGTAPLLSRPFVDAHFGFRGRVLSGQQQMRPRWARGLATVNGALGEVTGRLYVERHFTAAQKARMQELVSNLLATFRDGIEELEWMSPETRAQAQAKLARFTVKIGYPETWRDYSALQVRGDDLVGNLRRASDFSFARMVGRLGQPIDRGEWFMTPQTVNAYYSSTMNEIVFPAAILQPPFFNQAADDAVNYGAIGAVIGHEISHGFDDQGSRSDGEGNLRNWWTERDGEEFRERTDALVAQYGAFEPLPGQRINGKLTLGENIGDVSGVAVAYKAYRRSLDGKEAPVIGGLTGDQRFFLGYAQIWRGKYRDEALRQRLLTDSHSPGEFRVNGVVRNLPEFYAAFGVKPGDALYLPPEQRVKIW